MKIHASHDRIELVPESESKWISAISTLRGIAKRRLRIMRGLTA